MKAATIYAAFTEKLDGVDRAQALKDNSVQLGPVFQHSFESAPWIEQQIYVVGRGSRSVPYHAKRLAARSRPAHIGEEEGRRLTLLL
jgi:hypothetical protein